MKNYIGFLWKPLLILLLLSSCSEDQSFLEETETIVPRPSVKVSASIVGLVLEGDERPVENAEVIINEQNTFTDVNGYFKLNGLYDQANTFITIKKEGYFDAHGTVMPTEDGVIQVQFLLSLKDAPVTADATQDLTVNTSDYNIEFVGGGFESNGQSYVGDVTVHSRYIDPSDQKSIQQAPGTFLTNDEGVLRLINPLAIVDVELYSDDNRAINISKPATINLRIPSSLLSSAPNEVSLWHLNSDIGLWESKGVATKDGDRYIATVSSFSSWCVGTPWDIVEVSGQITRDGTGYPFARHRIGAGGPSYQADQNGNYNRLVIKDVSFDFVILDACRTEVHSESVNAPSEDIILDVAVNGSSNSVEIMGTLFGCDSEVLADGYALVNFPGNNFFEIIPIASDGSYQFLYEECSAESVVIKGYDFSNDLASASIEVTTSGTYDLTVCQSIGMQQLSIEIEGGETYLINNCIVTVEDGSSGVLVGNKYTFKVIDTFTAIQGGDGESVIYEWIITIFENEGVLPLIGNNPLPIKSNNPPVEWLLQFDPIEPYTLNIVDGFVDLTIGVSEQYSAKITDGVSEELGGVTTMHFIGKIQ